MDASSNKTFTLYCANCTGMESNCNYPNPVEITDVDALHCAASRDYVVAQFKHNYRNTANFVSANCLCKDCDNDHSDNPDEWVTPEDVRRAFPDVPLGIHYSRNHMKSKRGKKSNSKLNSAESRKSVRRVESSSKQKMRSSPPHLKKQGRKLLVAIRS